MKWTFHDKAVTANAPPKPESHALLLLPRHREFDDGSWCRRPPQSRLEREAKAGKLTSLLSRLKPAVAPILVHGHCHQKAFAEITPTLAVLGLIPDAKPSLIESSCCGMAGAFGYDATHYDVSMQMAELSLLPAIRKAPDAIVVADGTSCRHQIRDGAAREAKHAIRVLAEHLQ